MTSLCQEIVNWVTTADGCVHTADATQLDCRVASASAVCIKLYLRHIHIIQEEYESFSRRRTVDLLGPFLDVRLEVPLDVQ